jgi:hypothetical protein
MVHVRAVVGSLVLAGAMTATFVAARAQQPQAPAPGQTPQSPAQSPAQPGVPGQPAGPAAVQTRTFTAPAGLIFNTVRPERAADFEKVMAYLKVALEKSTDETVRAQARGWRVYKASEQFNGAVLYIYEIDPTVVGAEYGLGRILADAYPERQQLDQIWKLYRDAVTGGGSLLNLTPLKTGEPPPLAPVPAEKP